MKIILTTLTALAIGAGSLKADEMTQGLIRENEQYRLRELEWRVSDLEQEQMRNNPIIVPPSLTPEEQAKKQVEEEAKQAEEKAKRAAQDAAWREGRKILEAKQKAKDEESTRKLKAEWEAERKAKTFPYEKAAAANALAIFADHQAKNRIGTNASVCGVAYGAKLTRNGDAIIYFVANGKRVFVVILKAQVVKQLGNRLARLEWDSGNMIYTGKIIRSKGLPAIEVSSTVQMRHRGAPIYN
jgi:hypothetical protein